MSARVDLLRGIYDAMLREDIEPWLAKIPEDFEWRWPPGMIEGAAVFRGRAGVRQGTEMWAEAWQQLAMEPQEIVERGDEVFVILRYRARGRMSGVELDQPIAHRWHFRGDEPDEMRIETPADQAKHRFLAEES